MRNLHPDQQDRLERDSVDGDVVERYPEPPDGVSSDAEWFAHDLRASPLNLGRVDVSPDESYITIDVRPGLDTVVAEGLVNVYSRVVETEIADGKRRVIAWLESPPARRSGGDDDPKPLVADGGEDLCPQCEKQIKAVSRRGPLNVRASPCGCQLTHVTVAELLGAGQDSTASTQHELITDGGSDADDDRFDETIFDPINTVETVAELDREVEESDDRMFCPASQHYCKPANGHHPEHGPTQFCRACDCWSLTESKTQYLANQATTLGFELTPKMANAAVWERKAKTNVDRWGQQPPTELVLALSEELGELADEILPASYEGLHTDYHRSVVYHLLCEIREIGYESRDFLERLYEDQHGDPLPLEDRPELDFAVEDQQQQLRDEVGDTAALMFQLSWALEQASADNGVDS